MTKPCSGRLVAALVTVGLASTAVACGDQTRTPAPSAAASTSNEPPSAKDIQDAFETVAYDYTPTGSEKELTELAAGIVTGTVARVVPGRISGARSMDDAFALRTSAVALTVGQVEKGDFNSGEVIWLELPVTPDRLAGVLKPGLPVSAYLSPAPQGSDGFPYGLDGSQVPSSADLWVPAHPEGLIFEYGNDRGTVAPLADEVDPGDNLPG